MATLEAPAAPQEASPAPAESRPAESTGGGGAGPADSFATHPYLYPAPLKTPLPGKPLKKQLAALLGSEKEQQKDGSSFLDAVDAARKELGSGALGGAPSGKELPPPLLPLLPLMPMLRLCLPAPCSPGVGVRVGRRGD